MKTYVTTSIFGLYKEVTTDRTVVNDGKIIETYEINRYIFGILFSTFKKTEERRVGLKDTVNGIFNGTIEEDD